MLIFFQDARFALQELQVTMRIHYQESQFVRKMSAAGGIVPFSESSRVEAVQVRFLEALRLWLGRNSQEPASRKAISN